MRLEKVSLPAGSLASAAFPRLDYVDAYRGAIHTPFLRPEEVFKAFFRTAPSWVSSLLELRNALVRGLGLKAPAKGREDALRDMKVEVGQSVGLFRVFGKTDNEVLAGEDDRHLDFRVSYFLEPPATPGAPYGFTLATVVRYRNALGRAYFAVVRPFHRLIVPVMMRSMIRALERPAPAAGEA